MSGSIPRAKGGASRGLLSEDRQVSAWGWTFSDCSPLSRLVGNIQLKQIKTSNHKFTNLEAPFGELQTKVEMCSEVAGDISIFGSHFCALKTARQIPREEDHFDRQRLIGLGRWLSENRFRVFFTLKRNLDLFRRKIAKCFAISCQQSGKISLFESIKL